MSPSVAIVDDHFLFAEALAGAIRDVGGHTVVGIAVTGPQAISLVREEQPDVILADYHMPGYRGDELIARLQATSPRSRVIVITSDTTELSRAKAGEAGAVAYITKDRAIDDVVAALREATLTRAASDEQYAPTPRELQILRLLDSGKDAAAIAGELGLSVHTVRTHLANVFAKLGAHSQVEALAAARNRRLLR